MEINTRQLRRALLPRTLGGNRRHVFHSVPDVVNGVSEATVPLCRLSIFGGGFQSVSGSYGSCEIKVSLSCRELSTIQTIVVFRSGNTWRVKLLDLFVGGITDPVVPIDFDVYTASGVLVPGDAPFTSANYIELRLKGIPQFDIIRPLVSSILEFSDTNYSVWYYDSERELWEDRPITGIIGCSDMEADDLQDLIFFNYSEAPYGDRYRFMGSEKRGFWNFAKGGDLVYDVLDRMRVNAAGNLELYHPNIGWQTHDFNRIYFGCGTNDSAARVLKRRGVTAKLDWQRMAGWDEDVIGDIDRVIQLIGTAWARPIEVRIVLFSAVTDPQGTVDTGGNWPVRSLDDGSNAGNMTVQDWTDIAEEWGNVSDAIFEYATDRKIKVVDWFTMSELHRFDNSPGSWMCVGSHYNIHGWLSSADNMGGNL